MSTSAYSYQYLIKIVSIKSIKTEMIDFKEAPLELIFLYFVISLILLYLVVMRLIKGDIFIVRHSFADRPFFKSFYAYGSIVVIVLLQLKAERKYLSWAYPSFLD